MHIPGGSSWESSRSPTLTYFGVRALTEGNVSSAVANAIDLVHVERKLDLDWEDAVQGLVLGEQTLLDAVNAMYIWGHWPLLIVGGFLLFRLGPAEYRRLRTVILISGGARARGVRRLPGGTAAARPGRPAGHRHAALGDLPHGPAAVADQRVRRDAELPRRMEPAARDRAVPRQPATAPAGVRGRSCRPRWRSPWSPPPTTSSSTSSAGAARRASSALARRLVARRAANTAPLELIGHVHSVRRGSPRRQRPGHAATRRGAAHRVSSRLTCTCGAGAIEVRHLKTMGPAAAAVGPLAARARLDATAGARGAARRRRSRHRADARPQGARRPPGAPGRRGARLRAAAAAHHRLLPQLGAARAPRRASRRPARALRRQPPPAARAAPPLRGPAARGHLDPPRPARRRPPSPTSGRAPTWS